MSVLVIAEHDHKTIKPVTLNVITAARKIDTDVHVLVAGTDCSGAALAAANIHGITKVIKCDAPELSHRLAENMAPILVDLATNYTHILAPATTFGKNVMPRAAALLDTQQISDITVVHDGETFDRPIYAGNAIATVKSSDSKKLITVRGTAFDPVNAEGGSSPVEDFASKGDAGISSFVKQELSESDRPELTAANIVVSGGRGLGSGENFALIEALADKLGAAIGASRAAVDAGYVPNDYQVGQTGKVVAPDLYIAIGISGAIQHLAGMKGSKTIVAINKDEEAPIFGVADYGLVADLFEAVPELTKKL
ncbi:MAG: electron transfer flavoprotein subunit alpha/FixB family protein [Alphaproteobacteria bacterium]|nr:electron transfer flavoprotein subunit alpha/FixB family protein [Alphaproteobacteria bacterium]NCQ87841.1 electron transfer flavoprotein subunit alpha/FixB family protein [Alphaproteobacteria bacterium]NCT05651.1 electron transfer flavoprotein subunit alpha/FixB family protein [Alphaproteobacteria bacterium]